VPRYRQFQQTNVLEEARIRMRHIYDTFDNVTCMFSGGKDSLSVLYLAREVGRELGYKRVRAVFRDEEFIHQETVDFITELREREADWLDLEWWAVPMLSVSYVLTETKRVLFWDPDREWARQPPDFALRAADLGLPEGVVIEQHNADHLTCRGQRGRVALVTGVRAAESIQRYRACVNKLSENYIVASQAKQAALVRPIFDWSDDDVFRFIYDLGIQYCPIYDHQLWGGAALRTSTAVNPQAAKVLHHLEGYDPELYERMIDVLPDMAVQRRYWAEYDAKGILDRYSTSWDQIEAWVLQAYSTPDQTAKALDCLAATRIRADISPGAYPLRYVLQSLMRQSGRRDILPLKPKEAAAYGPD